MYVDRIMGRIMYLPASLCVEVVLNYFIFCVDSNKQLLPMAKQLQAHTYSFEFLPEDSKFMRK